MPDFTKPWEGHAVLVEFSWGPDGSPHYARYTNWSSPLVVDGDTYSPVDMTVVPGQENGGTEDRAWTITTRPVPPLDQFVRPYAPPVVAARFWEYDPLAGGTTVLRHSGRCSKSTRNPAGARGLIKVDVSGWKSLIQYPLGLQANPDCEWNFGDSNCKVDVGPLQETQAITAVTRGTILHVSPALPDRLWGKGTVEVDGLGLNIIWVDTARVKFRVHALPPPEWVGQVALWTPGCDRKPMTCDFRYGNLENFAGFGIAIPEYNPLLGSPK